MPVSIPRSLVLSSIMTLALGCGDGTTTITGGSTPCDETLQTARNSLEDILFFEINDANPQRPSDVDIRQAMTDYQAVLECEPANAEAHFVMSLLEIATLSTDASVNAAFDEWDTYLATYTPFETDPPGLIGPGPFGLPERGVFSLPVEVVRRSVLASMRAGLQGGVPQISTTQAILETKVIPAATRAIDHIGRVLNDPAYEFTITPKMQGDMLEDPLVADRTDFLAVRAILHGLRAATRAAVGYEVSMANYDETAILAALNQSDGTWLGLRPGGASHMAGVPADLLAAAHDLDNAITSLFAEIDGGDNQDDEIIKIGPNLPTRSELTDFQSNELSRIMRSLQGPTAELYDWDFNPATPDVVLTIDLHGFFTDPPQNLKTLAPPYVVSTEVIPFSEHYFYGNVTRQVGVDVPQAGVSYAWCQLSYSNFELAFDYCSGDAWLQAALRSALESEATLIRARPDWAGDLYVYASFYGALAAGPQTIDLRISVSYSAADTWVAVPILTFDANSYAEWAASWPDPTLGGLFPAAISTAELLTIFGMSEHDWGKVLRLDWHNGFQIVNLRAPSLLAGR
jgi:hypothetical protein